MESNLKVTITHQPGIAIVTLEGEARLQLKELEMQMARVSAEHPAIVILEMSGLSMMSSLGMGLLVSVRAGLKRRGGRLLAAGTQPIVLDSFKRARLESIFEVFETFEAALASVQPVNPPES